MKRDAIARKAAEIEIAEAAVWYEEHQPSLGHRFLEAVDQAFEEISERPLAWPVWRAHRPYRKYLVPGFPFAVFYKVDASNVIVVAVAHTHRKPGYWLSRER